MQIRLLQERLGYITELNERRETILKSIEEQGKLTAELRGEDRGRRQKTELEDLYLPFKPKRRTKASIARERGLEPLAERTAAPREPAPAEQLAEAFVDREGGARADAALAGAGHILAERFAEDAGARARVRELTWKRGCSAPSAAGKEGTVSKYEMYYDYQRAAAADPLPPHAGHAPR